ncbi:MAG TPA: phosphatase PAP2 family protein [Firmicutes bacterium]|nr:phosphatase PAP2 family protein [Bacillota bacterium]
MWLSGLKNRLANGDTALFRWFNRGCRVGFLDKAFSEATRLGSPFVVIPVCLGAWATGIEQLRQTGLQGLIALASSHAVVRLLKATVKRQRPYMVLSHVAVRGPRLRDLSFPSGHTAAAFSVATCFAATFPGIALLFTLLASLVGVSRMYVGMHYPSDVIFGAFLGSASVWLARLLF